MVRCGSGEVPAQHPAHTMRNIRQRARVCEIELAWAKDGVYEGERRVGARGPRRLPASGLAALIITPHCV